MRKLFTVGLLALSALAANAAINNFDVTGINSWDALNDTDNEIRTIDLGGGNPATMTGIGWDVVITAFGASWQSELAVLFSDSTGAGGFTLRPGAGVNSPGSGAYASGGIINLVDVGLPNLVLADGILRMQFFESFDDANGSIDGTWNSGQLNIQYDAVPEPATLLALAGGLAVLALRRRK